jgi:hypothetical protein
LSTAGGAGLQWSFELAPRPCPWKYAKELPDRHTGDGRLLKPEIAIRSIRKTITSRQVVNLPMDAVNEGTGVDATPFLSALVTRTPAQITATTAPTLDLILLRTALRLRCQSVVSMAPGLSRRAYPMDDAGPCQGLARNCAQATSRRPTPRFSTGRVTPMPAIFILNPYANRWRAGQCKDEALATLPAAGVQTGTRAHPTLQGPAFCHVHHRFCS